MQDFLRCKNEPFDSSVYDFIFYECSFLCAAVEKIRIYFIFGRMIRRPHRHETTHMYYEYVSYVHTRLPFREGYVTFC